MKHFKKKMRKLKRHVARLEREIDILASATQPKIEEAAHAHPAESQMTQPAIAGQQ